MEIRYVVQFRGRYLRGNVRIGEDKTMTDDPYSAAIFTSRETADKISTQYFGDSFEAYVVAHGFAIYTEECKHNEQIAEQGQQDEESMRETDEGFAELRGMA